MPLQPAAVSCRSRARRVWHALVLVILAALVAASAGAGQLPSPESFFGFQMGADHELAGWPEIQRYFEQVAAASDRVELVDAGPTTDGNRLIAAIISAPENIRNLDAIKAANRRLADPRTLAPAEAREIAAANKLILAIGCSIHASEVGATQMANELLHRLATSDDPRTQAVLRDVVIILFPSLNPDGHVLITDWHRRTRRTMFEGSPMPWLYHRYVGHDINRDAFMLNMAENRTLARFFYGEWHPQVFLTMHQMGQRGPRFFVPPNYEPIDPNYDPLIWRTAGLLGHAMALELERDGRAGVVSNAMYDYYWPGYEDSAPLGHNTVCLLTEAASVRLAAPVTVAPSELTGTPRGLPDYRPQVNFPNPWPGGLWRLRDIVDYELSAARGLLDGAARYRVEILENFYTMGRRAVELGEAGSPYAFVIPPAQHDPHAAAKLKNLLIEGGVEVHRAIEPFRAGGIDYAAGTDLVLMAQPFRAYAKTLLEPQAYPARRLTTNAPPERPYDVAGWTLPYQMGVDVARVDARFPLPATVRLERAAIEPSRVGGDRRPSFYVIAARGNGGAIAANRLLAANLRPSWTRAGIEIDGHRYEPGALVVRHSRQARAVVDTIAAELGLPVSGVSRSPAVPLAPINPARVGLYKPWVENSDEGWTRWLLEQYESPFRTVADAEIRAGDLRRQFNVIVLPDATPDRLVAGHRPDTVPPEYAGGLGPEGVAALKAFVEQGGTLICLDSSGGLAIETFQLPIKDMARDLPPQQFFCPGSILRLELDPAHPLAFGIPARTAAFFAYSSAYEVRAASPTDAPGRGHAGPIDAAASDRAVSIVGRYGQKDLLMSGWLEGEATITGRAGIVEARVASGRVVLIGFRAQHRAQSHATFRLLFNAILTAR